MKFVKVSGYIAFALTLSTLDSLLELDFYDHIVKNWMFWVLIGVSVALHVASLLCAGEEAVSKKSFNYFSKMGATVALLMVYSVAISTLSQYSVFKIADHSSAVVQDKINDLVRERDGIMADQDRYRDADRLTIGSVPLQQKVEALNTKIADLRDQSGVTTNAIYQPIAEFLHIPTDIFIVLMVIVRSVLLNVLACVFFYKGIYAFVETHSNSTSNSSGTKEEKRDKSGTINNLEKKETLGTSNNSLGHEQVVVALDEYARSKKKLKTANRQHVLDALDQKYGRGIKAKRADGYIEYLQQQLDKNNDLTFGWHRHARTA